MKKGFRVYAKEFFSRRDFTKRELKRILKYASAGIIAFALDLAIFWILMNKTTINYIFVTIISFIIANTLNYFLNRSWSFKETKVGLGRGYVVYSYVAVTGLVLITFGMYILVHMLNAEEFAARIAVGVIVGVWNYLVNRLVTFEIPILQKLKQAAESKVESPDKK